MDTANVFDTKSIKLELQPGEYFWCACGKSKNQPWCDSSHKGGAFSPVKLTVAEAMSKSICLCKQSKNPPFCDGSHKPLREAAMAAANAAAVKMAAERAQSAGPAQ